MENVAQSKVGELVAENFHIAQVFTKYGIDFCCTGGITLEQACQKNNVSLQDLLLDLNNLDSPTEEMIDFQLFRQDVLANYIVEKHHKYVEEIIPVLQTYLYRLCSVHGENHPELFEIRDLFDETAESLKIHMMKEEQILFPYIKSMREVFLRTDPFDAPVFGHIEHPIQMMEAEHIIEGERFRKIAQLSNYYAYPADACDMYRAMLDLLKEFEQNLHTHIHLENNILFPKARHAFEELYAW